MRQGQKRDPEKDWGAFTTNSAESYFDKLGIRCATKEQYIRWFILSERAGTKCRTLPSFCKDCRPEYAAQMRSQGCCRKADLESRASDVSQDQQ